MRIETKNQAEIRQTEEKHEADIRRTENKFETDIRDLRKELNEKTREIDFLKDNHESALKAIRDLNLRVSETGGINDNASFATTKFEGNKTKP